MNKLGAIITAKRLAEVIGSSPKNFRILDGTWFLPNYGKTGIQSYQEEHIPGAQFFDINGCIDAASKYDHMLPKPAVFADYVGNLGINNDTHVIVYDNHDDFAMFSAPRIWWTFRIFGHESVSVLSGGLKTWRDEKFEVTKVVKSVEKQKFQANFKPHLIKSFEDIERNIEEKSFQLVDARSGGRFNGTEPEPRPETQPGHIPGSSNIPFPEMMTAYDSPSLGQEVKRGQLKGVTELKAVFDGAGVDITKPLTVTCGTGVSSAILALGAHLCGESNVPIYDGSWVEWYLRSRPDQRVDSPAK